MCKVENLAFLMFSLQLYLPGKNIRIIRNIGTVLELSKEKLLKNEEMDALNDIAKKDNLFSNPSNPKFFNIKCKYNNYIIFFFSSYAI